jgi:hypothetical protein
VLSSRVELEELASRGMGSNTVPPLVISRLVLTSVTAAIATGRLESYAAATGAEERRSRKVQEVDARVACPVKTECAVFTKQYQKSSDE